MEMLQFLENTLCTLKYIQANFMLPVSLNAHFTSSNSIWMNVNVYLIFIQFDKAETLIFEIMLYKLTKYNWFHK